MPFLTAAAAGFMFLDLTQETKARFPLSGKRAAWYTLAAALIALGLTLVFVTYFSVEYSGGPFELAAALAVIVPFVLPGGGILSFLILTEKNRLKPWAAGLHTTATRFGLFSGAIWLFACALFLLAGFLAGFKYAWLIFIAAAATQLLVRGLMKKE